MRIRNFAVGPVNIYCDEDGTRYAISRNRELHTTNRLAWFCGEINVTQSEIRPNTPREALEMDSRAKRLIEEIREFYKSRIDDAGAHSDFNGFKKAVDDAKAFLQKMNGRSLSVGSADHKDQMRLVAKLEEASNKTKGSAGSSAKATLRSLLNRPTVKTERKRVLTQLKALTPTAAAKSGGRNGSPRTGDNEKRSDVCGASKSNGDGAATLTFEDLMTDIVAILEDHLGADHENLAAIAEAITTALKERGLHHANQPIP
jgi:hypothetical protein